MEKVVEALALLLRNAVPTFVLVLLLYIFLKKMFFNPLEQILHQRHQATEGAMQSARERLELVDRKSAEYQQALREARAEMYRALERERQQTVEECAQQVRRARTQAEEQGRMAREELRTEVERAKAMLAEESGAMADSITEAVLRARAETAR